MRILISLILVFRYFLFSFDYFEKREDASSFHTPYNQRRNPPPIRDGLNKYYTATNVLLNDSLDQKEKKLLVDTTFLQVFMVGTIVILYMMPPSVTNWEEDLLKIDLAKKWQKNVTDGPVWDEDDWAINYIGHPVSGAWYYMVAREDGFGPWESFMYSFVLSTFFWEYGWESFAEIPSTQDLIFTPTLGAMMGEGFYYFQNILDKNGGVIWGSKTLGNIAYFFLNPLGRITESMNDVFHLHGSFRYKTFQEPVSMQTSPLLRNVDYVPQHFGFLLEIKF